MEFWLAYKNYSMSGTMHDIAQFEDLHLFTRRHPDPLLIPS